MMVIADFNKEFKMALINEQNSKSRSDHLIKGSFLSSSHWYRSIFCSVIVVGLFIVYHKLDEFNKRDWSYHVYWSHQTDEINARVP